MQLEVDFFAAQPYQPPPPLPIALVVSDFDDTMIKGETTAAIAETAIAHARTSRSGVCICPMEHQ